MGQDQSAQTPAQGAPATTNALAPATQAAPTTQTNAATQNAGNDENMDEDADAEDDFDAEGLGDRNFGDEAFDFDENEGGAGETPSNNSSGEDDGEEGDGGNGDGGDERPPGWHPADDYTPRRYSDQDERINHTLSISPIRDEVFRHLNLDEAMAIERVAPIRADNGVGGPIALWKFREIGQRTCESPFTNPPPGRILQSANPGPGYGVPPYEPVGQVHPLCTNDVTYRSWRLGRRELSMCQCPDNDPRPATHPHPKPHSPLV